MHRSTHAPPISSVPMIALVEDLLAKGVAYRGDDGSVYFAIGKFPSYGRLSQLDRRELKAGASERVSADEYGKEDVRDFALWKAAKPEDEAVGAAWDAPFGRGRPGWHLECSAMALDLIKQKWGTDVLDIHAGGVDLIFPHHEDEIAQSCAYTGRNLFARYWVHGEFLKIGGEKMAKRYGNITTARDLREDHVDAGAVRLLMFQVHYRQQLDLTDEGLASAAEGSRRLGEFQRRLQETAAASDAPEFVALAERLEREVADGLDDDLNAPRAVAALFSFVGAGNAAMDAGRRPGPKAVAAWTRVEGILGVTQCSDGAQDHRCGGDDRWQADGPGGLAAPGCRGTAGVGACLGGSAKTGQDGARFCRGRSHPGSPEGGRLGGPGWAGWVGRSGKNRPVGCKSRARPLTCRKSPSIIGVCVFRPVLG